MAPERKTGNTVLLVFGLGAFVSFLLIATLVFSDATQSFDTQLALATYQTQLGPRLSQVMVLSSKYGRECFWIPIVALMGIFGKRKTRLLAIELAILFTVGIIAGDLIKSLAFRPRPFNSVPGILPRIPEDSDSSFPSGHAVIVSIGAIFLLVASFIRKGGFRARVASILLVIEAATVCYSRVYLGLHYPLDVLGGISFGAAVALAGIFVFEKYLRRAVDRGGDIIERFQNSLHIPQTL